MRATGLTPAGAPLRSARNFFHVLLVALFLATSTLSGSSGGSFVDAADAAKPPFRKGGSTLRSTTHNKFKRIVVSFEKPGLTKAELQQVRDNVPGLVGLKVLHHVRTIVGICESFQDQEKAIEEFYKFGRVKVAMRDALVRSTGAKVFWVLRGPLLEEKRRRYLNEQQFPNDRYFGDQWGWHQDNDADADLPEAWGVYASENPASGTNPKPVVVAVIDTGVDYTHGDLKDHLWRNPREIAGNGIDDDGNGFVDDVHGVDFFNEDGDPMDDEEHGTHCAGIIAATANNNAGIAGVASFAPDVQIMAIKFLDNEGYGTLSDGVQGVEYAIQNGAQISSNSWGADAAGFIVWSAFTSMLNAAEEAGHLFIGASGNNGWDIDGSSNIPCSLNADNLLCVGSSTAADSMSSFSNFGRLQVDVAAPGSSILSTVPNERYAFFSGTSMACPFVAGEAALLWSFRPELNYNQVRDLILATVDRKDAWVDKLKSAGRVNVHKAMLKAKTDFTQAFPPTAMPTSMAFTDTDNRVGRVAGNVRVQFDPSKPSVRDGGVTAVNLYFVRPGAGGAAGANAATGAPGETMIIRPKLNVTAFNYVTAANPYEVEFQLLDSNIPKYVTHLIAMAANATGENPSSNAKIALVDVGVPQGSAQNFRVTPDVHTAAGIVQCDALFHAGDDESDVTHYELFMYNPASNMRDRPLAKLPAKGFFPPKCNGDCGEISVEPVFSEPQSGEPNVRKTGYRVKLRPASGRYAVDATATMTVVGPAQVRFDFLNTEMGYDYLEFGSDTIVTGETMPPVLSLPAGQHSIKWHSDHSIAREGWEFVLATDFSYRAPVWIEDFNSAAFPALAVFSSYNGAYAENNVPHVAIADDTSGGDAGGAPPAAKVDSGLFLDDDLTERKLHGTLSIRMANLAPPPPPNSPAPTTPITVTRFKAVLLSRDTNAVGQPQVVLLQDLGEIPAVANLADMQIDVDLKNVANAPPAASSPGPATRPPPELLIEVLCGNEFAFASEGVLIPAHDVYALPLLKGSFGGDLDADVGEVSGDVSLVPPPHAVALTRFNAYWSAAAADPSTTAPHTPYGPNRFKSVDLEIVCPPHPSSADMQDPLNEFARLPCTNPYQPKCRGRSCGLVQIMEDTGSTSDHGPHGGFLLSRTGSGSGAATGNYGSHEFAELYFPYGGEIEVVSMDVELVYDWLHVKWRPDHTANGGPLDLAYLDVGDKVEVEGGKAFSNLEWKTDATIDKNGWVLRYRPKYPTIPIPMDTVMPPNTAGLRVYPEYHGYRSVPKAAAALSASAGEHAGGDSPTGSSAKTNADPANQAAENMIAAFASAAASDRESAVRTSGYEASAETAAYFVAIDDWVQSTATCSATSMRCPIPAAWASYNYIAPKPDDSPAECTMQRTSDNAAFFEFTKQKCGSIRSFDTARGMIVDSITLVADGGSVAAAAAAAAEDESSAVENHAFAGILSFMDGAKREPAVLPPEINCRCEAPMFASATGVSVNVEEATAAPPVQSGPIDMVGRSEMRAGMRLFQDPTFAQPLQSGEWVPHAVDEFFVEVSTEFVGNRVSVRGCKAAKSLAALEGDNKEQGLAGGSGSENVDGGLGAAPGDEEVVVILDGYCPTEVFNVKNHAAPTGVTHLDRISFRKFRFTGQSEVFLQCELEACEQKPCGTCGTDGSTADSDKKRRALLGARSLLQRMVASKKELSKSGRRRAAAASANTAQTAPFVIRVSSGDANALAAGRAAPARSEPWLQNTGSGPTAVAAMPELETTWTKPVEPLDAVLDDAQQYEKVSSRMTLTGLDPDWAANNVRSLEDTLKRTLALQDGEEVRVKSDLGALLAGMKPQDNTMPAQKADDTNRPNWFVNLVENEKQLRRDEGNPTKGIIVTAAPGAAAPADGSMPEKTITYQSIGDYISSSNPSLNAAPAAPEDPEYSRPSWFSNLVSTEKQLRRDEGSSTRGIVVTSAPTLAAVSTTTTRSHQDEVRRRLAVAAASARSGVVQRSPSVVRLRARLLAVEEKKAKLLAAMASRTSSNSRALQTGGGSSSLATVSIDFEVYLKKETGTSAADSSSGSSSSTSNRGAFLETKMALLASGSPTITATFTTVLDEELVSRNKTPVRLEPERITFREPVRVANGTTFGVVSTPTLNPGGGGTSTSTSSSGAGGEQSATTADAGGASSAEGDDGDDGAFFGLLDDSMTSVILYCSIGAAGLLAILFGCYFRKCSCGRNENGERFVSLNTPKVSPSKLDLHNIADEEAPGVNGHKSARTSSKKAATAGGSKAPVLAHPPKLAEKYKFAEDEDAPKKRSPAKLTLKSDNGTTLMIESDELDETLKSAEVQKVMRKHLRMGSASAVVAGDLRSTTTGGSSASIPRAWSATSDESSVKQLGIVDNARPSAAVEVIIVQQPNVVYTAADEQAAVKIQARARGVQARRKVAREKGREKAKLNPDF
eukprot:g5639.t1